MIRDDIAIRVAGDDSLPAVMEIMRAAFDPDFGEAWTSTQCAAMLAGLGAWLTVADWRGRPAGFALARAIADEAELLLLAVDPRVRGKGLGKALLAAVTDAGRSRGARRMFLEVRACNPAIALYRAAGFDKVGERRGYYRGVGGRMFDAHSYSRAISA